MSLKGISFQRVFGGTYGILIGDYDKVTTELRNRKELFPVSSKVEHTTDNRKTEERYLYWEPNMEVPP